MFQVSGQDLADALVSRVGRKAGMAHEVARPSTTRINEHTQHVSVIMNLGPRQRCFVPKPFNLVRLKRVAKFGIGKSRANFLRRGFGGHS